MDLRLATMEDLPGLKAAYAKVICRMEKEGIYIWNERYPYDVLQEDIAQERLYVLEREGVISAVFALCRESAGERFMQWTTKGKAMYLYRLGVCDAPRTGVGGMALDGAISIARASGAKSLRLFVVDSNAPALAFYRKYGFDRVDGVYEDSVADGPLLREYGFEKQI